MITFDESPPPKMELIPTRIDGQDCLTESTRMKRRVGWEEHYDEDGVLHDTAAWTEWWLDGVLVHRSADVVIHRVLEEMKPYLGLMNKKEEGDRVDG